MNYNTSHSFFVVVYHHMFIMRDSKQILTMQSAGKDVKQTELSYMASDCIKWHSHYGRYFVNFLKTLTHTQLVCVCAHLHVLSYSAMSNSATSWTVVCQVAISCSRVFSQPLWRNGKESACQCQTHKRHGFDP